MTTARPIASTQSPRPPNPRKIVFVVDDQPTIVDTMSTALTQAGYGMMTARDGAEALQVMKNTTVDILLVDVFMPRKDGIETIMALRKQPMPPPIIAMSGGGMRGEGPRDAAARTAARRARRPHHPVKRNLYASSRAFETAAATPIDEIRILQGD